MFAERRQFTDQPSDVQCSRARPDGSPPRPALALAAARESSWIFTGTGHVGRKPHGRRGRRL